MFDDDLIQQITEMVEVSKRVGNTIEGRRSTKLVVPEDDNDQTDSTELYPSDDEDHGVSERERLLFQQLRQLRRRTKCENRNFYGENAIRIIERGKSELYSDNLQQSTSWRPWKHSRKKVTMLCRLGSGLEGIFKSNDDVTRATISSRNRRIIHPSPLKQNKIAQDDTKDELSAFPSARRRRHSGARLLMNGDIICSRMQLSDERIELLGGKKTN